MKNIWNDKLHKKWLMIASFFLFAQWVGAVEISKPAPNFKLKDNKGKIHKLSDYQGKVVVLEWINFGCPFVKKHYRSENMQTLQSKYTEKEIVWLSICSSAQNRQGYYKSGKIQEELDRRGAKPTAYLIDKSGKVGEMYGAKTTPHMYIVDTQGKLVYQGAIDSIRSARPKDVEKAENYVAKALDEILEGEDVSIPKTKPYGCSVKYK